MKRFVLFAFLLLLCGISRATEYDVTANGVLTTDTDCAPEFSALINATPEGSAYYFPAGQYKFGSTVTIPSSRKCFKLVGDGCAPGTSVGSRISGDFAGALFYYNGNRTVRFEGVSFGNKNAAGMGVDLGTTTQASFDQCLFANCGAFGLRAGVNGNTFALSVRDTDFRSCGVGIAVDGHLRLDNVNLVGNGIGCRISGGGISIEGGRAEVNGTGWEIGFKPDGSVSSVGKLVMMGVTNEANDTAIRCRNVSKSHFAAINVNGTSNAPSGGSQIGLDVTGASYTCFENIELVGGYATAAVQISGQPFNHEKERWSQVKSDAADPAKNWVIDPLVSSDIIFEQCNN